MADASNDPTTAELLNRIAALEARADDQSKEIAALHAANATLNERLADLEISPPSRTSRAATGHTGAPGAARGAGTPRRASEYTPGESGKHGRLRSSTTVSSRRTPAGGAATGTPGTGGQASRRGSAAAQAAIARRLSAASSATPSRRQHTPSAMEEGAVRYRPLRGICFPPSDPPAVEKVAPSAELALEFVYGYRGRDCRDNLFQLPNGEYVYFAAGLGVVYNHDTHSQRFFAEHDDDIISMAVHPSLPLVATGQLDARGSRLAYILIWDYTTMERVALVDNAHDRRVVAMEFSPDGNLLYSVGADDAHTLKAHDWRRGTCVTSCRTHKDHVFAVAFNPVTNSVVACGKNMAKFIEVERAGATLSFKARNGITGKLGEQQPFLCIAVLPSGLTAFGCYSGDIYLFHGNKLAKVVPAHDGPVYALCQTPNGLLSGGKDGVVSLWGVDALVPGPDGVVTGEVSNLRRVHVGAGVRIRTLHSRDGLRIAMGSLDNGLYEVALGDGESVRPQVRPLITAHHAELWGLAAHPTAQLAATASDAGDVILFDLDARQVSCTLALPDGLPGKGPGGRARARGVAWSPDGSLLAIGLDDGAFVVFDANAHPPALVHTQDVRDRVEELQVLRFSPDGRLLAVGSHDNFVDLFDVARGWVRVGVLKGHSSFITSLDWSADSAHIRSTSGDYELLYWDVASLSQIRRPSALRDAAWATHTALLGWPVLGVWPEEADGTDVNAVGRSRGSGPVTNGDPGLLVAGDDFGQVALFTFPAPHPHMPRKNHPGHCSHVTGVEFTAANSRVVSIGGNDTCVLQWRVIGGPAETAAPDAVDIAFVEEAGAADAGGAGPTAETSAAPSTQSGKSVASEHDSDEEGA